MNSYVCSNSLVFTWCHHCTLWTFKKTYLDVLLSALTSSLWSSEIKNSPVCMGLMWCVVWLSLFKANGKFTLQYSLRRPIRFCDLYSIYKGKTSGSILLFVHFSKQNKNKLVENDVFLLHIHMIKSKHFKRRKWKAAS